VCIGDTDRDGHTELFFTALSDYFKIFIYELHLPDMWEVDSFFCAWDWAPILWDIGDFDIDGLYDLVIQTAVDTPPKHLISITETPDSFSYPTQEVWRDTVDIGTIRPICVYDIDKDGISEIVQTGGEPGSNYYIDFSIYEAIGDNVYQVKYYFESPTSQTSTIAFGDFDSDNQNEFVMGTIDGEYSVFECQGNDVYVPILINSQLPTGNIFDCFTVPDADRDGRLEFVLKGYTPPTERIETFFFEAVGNDTYAIIDSFFCYGGSGGHSDVGDVDGDSIPEIVLEACQNVYIIKAAGNDSFYVWDVLPGHNTGSNVRVFDFDDNGLAEIVISGNNETRIYEYEPGGVEEYTSGKPVNIGFTCLPNIVENDVHVSFTLLQQTQVSLNIYNSLGQRVKSICTGIQAAGCHSQKIYLTAFAAGVYFVQLKTPDQVIIQKVVKIK
jgi:hypothetical protein